jgi:hypothetical protein
MTTRMLVLAILVSLGSFAASSHDGAAGDATVPDLASLRAMTARFAPVEITADLSLLPERERRALAKLVDAARLMDGPFLEQVWAGNTSMLMQLAADGTPLGQARLHYFLINKGPWSSLDHDAPFVPGAPAKPASANFYPAGATKEEVAAWLDSPAGAGAKGFFTTIRRDEQGRFEAVPYSVEYQGALERAAELLREAADLTAQPSLARYLHTRADAFLSNDYYASDMAWMELDSSIEPTIGPYEVYEDGWFNLKAAFEAFVTVRDDAETRKLAVFGEHLQGLENALPIDPRYRNPKLGALAPIRVVNVVFSAGDGNRGVQTAAFNLPNDERVVRERGSKRVMLKNVQEAKFEKALVPIAKVALPEADQSRVSFDAFFTHTVMHELMHGLGPHEITVAGRATTVRQELKETYSTIEEAKADISGLWALQQLADQGVVDAAIARDMYTTFLASAFRAIRFGVNEAHGRGIAIQLNYLIDAGAVTAGPDGRFRVNEPRFKEATTALTHDIMTLQAEGSYAKAKDLTTRLGVVRPEVERVLDRLTDVPVDIEPIFKEVTP